MPNLLFHGRAGRPPRLHRLSNLHAPLVCDAHFAGRIDPRHKLDGQSVRTGQHELRVEDEVDAERFVRVGRVGDFYVAQPRLAALYEARAEYSAGKNAVRVVFSPAGAEKGK